jgi:hypothetical protein
MEMFKRVWRFALGAAIAALVSTAVLSCRSPSQSGEEVVIRENEVTGIEVTATRTVYGLNEVIDLTGLVVTATFEDETEGPFAVTAAHLSSATAPGAANASVPITITVNGHAEVFNIAVYDVVSKSTSGYTGRAHLDDAFEYAATGDTIIIYNDQTIKNGTNPSGITVTLNGYDSERKITHEPGGNMFNLSGAGTVLILGENITLDGEDKNNAGDSLVKVNSGAALRMKDDSTITGGKGVSSYGGGVYVYGGTFTMEGGTISGNTSYANPGCGGGVCVTSGGIFTMFGGTISGNEVREGGGGGVYVFLGGQFTMEDGTISENTAYNGGGVRIGYNGTFTYNGGAISENEAVGGDDGGGGVSVFGGTFTMSGGATISGNTAPVGGGVSVSGGTFTYNAGTIGDNTAETSGDAVYKNSYGNINGDGGVNVGDGDSSPIPYDVFPPED